MGVVPSRESRECCPCGKPGDLLWVREAFRFTSDFNGDSPVRVGERCLGAGYHKPWAPIRFEADGVERGWEWVGTPPSRAVTAGRLRANMHMPHWASRITLEATGVRVEQLQGISRFRRQSVAGHGQRAGRSWAACRDR
jgi:hypothetical protein